MPDTQTRYEEIQGDRYATWSQFRPFTVSSAKSYLAQVGVLGLFNVGALLGARWVAFHPEKIDVWLAGLCVVGFVLLFGLVSWGQGRRRERLQARYAEWAGVSSDVLGTPCTASIAGPAGRCVSVGTITTQGSLLIFRGNLCSFELQPLDEVQSSVRHTLFFRHQTPLGEQRTTVRLGGPSAGGWVKPSEALNEISGDLQAWRQGHSSGHSIYPPLRPHPTLTITSSLPHRSLLVGLAALFAMVVLCDVVRSLILYPITRPLSPWTDYAMAVACLVVTYGAVLGLGKLGRVRSEQVQLNLERLTR